MALLWGPGRNLICNDRWAEVVHGGSADKLGHSAEEALPAIWDVVKPAVQEVLARKEAKSVEINPFPSPAEEAGDRSIEFCFSSVAFDDTSEEAVLCLATETTERHRKHKAMVFAEAIVDTMPTPLLVLTADLVVKSANPQFYKQFQVKEQETIGHKVYDLGNGQWDIPELRELFEQILPDNDTFADYEVQHTFDTIGARRMLINGRRLDHVQEILLLIEDVTEKKEAEEASRREQERLRSALEIATVGVLFWGPDLTLRETNEALSRMSGFSREELIGKTWQDLTPSEHHQASVRAIEEIQQDGETTPYEKEYYRKDGTRWWGLFAARRLSEEETVEYVLDISEQKRAQETLERTAQELAESNRNKDEFLALLAHELRNPLAAIRTSVELIQTAREEPAIVEEALSAIGRQTEHLVVLVNDLLDVSRITRGRLRLRKTRIKLADALHSAVEALRHLIDERNHRLTVELPREDLVIDADPARLVQVIGNLLNNAAKYTPKGGHVRLSAERQEDSAVIRVEDSGIGFPPKMAQRIFELFTQIEHPSEHTNTGLGIGLTLVKSLVELHHGSVEARSPGIGRGSVFAIQLPIANGAIAEQQAPTDAPPEGAPQSRLRVLVVDDHPAAVRMLGLLVERLGYDVRTATDGRGALETAESFLPDVVLMDIGMPIMNGYEAARAMRETPWGRNVTLVALTGWGTEEDKRKAREAGFDQHIIKPAEPDDLRAALKRAEPASRGRTNPGDP